MKFSDIANYLQHVREHELVVKAEDSRSCDQPRGKQCWIHENFECWYVQTTGIWQTVWLEFVHECHLESVQITPDIDTSSISFVYQVAEQAKRDDLRIQTDIYFEGKPAKSFSF